MRLGKLLEDFIIDPPDDVHVAVAYFPHPQADYWFGPSDYRPWIEYKGGFIRSVTFRSALFQRLSPITKATLGTKAAAEAVGATIEKLSVDGTVFRARYLRPAGLWPAPGKGIRNTPVTATHITNLLLATVCGGRKDTVETVGRFRCLPLRFHDSLLKAA